MAYKIMQILAVRTLSDMGANRALNFTGPSALIFFPGEKNVNIKKVSVDAIFLIDTDVTIKNYYLEITFVQKSNGINLNPEPVTFINRNSGAGNSDRISINCNKSNPIQNIDLLAGGIRISSDGWRSGLVLSNITSTIPPSVQFQITIYYND